MAKWPTSVATDADLYVAVNSLQTTLSTALGTGDVSVVLASATGFPVAGGVTIGNEVIFYTGVSGATLTGCTRGADGTTAATHSIGVPVGAAIIAFHHNGLKAEIEAIETDLDARFGRGASSNTIVVPSAVSFTLAATSNQMILGATRTVTITAPTPASTSRTWTIPDIASDATFVALEGTQTLSGTKTFSAAVTINPATNQLILGGVSAGKKVTITAPAPATADRTWTIPDITSDATFAALEGTQSFSGTKTFTAAVTINPATNQLILGGVSSGKKITITAPAPATADRVWTIPDITADGTFAALQGAQTFSGAKTFSGGVTLSGSTIAMGANKITGLAAATANGDAVRYEQWHVAANVVYANTTTVTATSSTALADITNLTASITPSSSSNKVLVRGMINIAVFPTSGNSQDVVVALTDGSNVVMLQCDALAGAGGGTLSGEYFQATHVFEYLDSPATTSSKTYKFRVALALTSTSGTATVNYASGAGGGNPTYSSITLQEIPA